MLNRPRPTPPAHKSQAPDSYGRDQSESRSSYRRCIWDTFVSYHSQSYLNIACCVFCRLTKKAEPPPTCDVNRDSGTASANGGWLRRLVIPRVERVHHRLPFQSQMRMIAAQKRSPQKPAAKAQTPTVARKINEPVIKEWLNSSAREMPEKTPNTAPQVNCIQKLPRSCLYSSGVIARKWPRQYGWR